MGYSCKKNRLADTCLRKEVDMLGDQLRQARQAAGLTIAALAAQSGVRVATISEIETGVNKNPGIFTIIRLADVLQVSLDDLAERKVKRPRRRTPKPAVDQEGEAA
jgi:transcriptional regulator with XRE-family HTH domain